jgi:hypothetical protein
MVHFCYVSPVFGFCFCIYIISTSTSGNTLVAQVYVCMNVYFPPFWNYVGGIDVSITTANSRHHPHGAAWSVATPASTSRTRTLPWRSLGLLSMLVGD